MTNIKSYESKDLQTFFEVLRLRMIKRHGKTTLSNPEAYSEPSQTSKMEYFAIILCEN